VIQVELMARPSLTAVLAGAFVPGVNVVSAEANLALGYSVITHQKDDTWNPNRPIDHADRFVMHGYREVTPTFEIKGLVLRIHGFGDSLVKQDESPAHRGDVDRQIRTIKNQYLGIEYRIDRGGRGIIH